MVGIALGIALILVGSPSTLRYGHKLSFGLKIGGGGEIFVCGLLALSSTLRSNKLMWMILVASLGCLVAGVVLDALDDKEDPAPNTTTTTDDVPLPALWGMAESVFLVILLYSIFLIKS